MTAIRRKTIRGAVFSAATLFVAGALFVGALSAMAGCSQPGESEMVALQVPTQPSARAGAMVSADGNGSGEGFADDSASVKGADTPAGKDGAAKDAPAPVKPAGGPKLDDAKQKLFDGLVEKLKAAENLGAAYAVAEKIEDLGTAAGKALSPLVAGFSIYPRIAACRALYNLGEMTAAVKTLAAAVAEDGERPPRLAAAELLTAVAGESHKKIIQDALDATQDTPLRIELAVILYDTARAPRAKQELYELLNSESANYRQQAALGLGRCKDLTRCREIIEALADEPTDRGYMAKEILRRDRLSKEYEALVLRTAANPNSSNTVDAIKIDTTILDKVASMIRERYIYTDRVTTRKLMLAAAAGVVAGLDPYTAYFDAGQTRRSAEIRRYTAPTLGMSIGAKRFRAGLDVRIPTIVAVTPGSPAARAGLRAGDQIWNVAPNATFAKLQKWAAGTPTEYGETVEEFLSLKLSGVVDTLQGEPGKSVGVMVRRDGWLLSRWVLLMHEAPTAPAFASEMLPGQLGYARVISMDAETPAALKAALTKLKADGAKGLLLDLRDCSGGSFEAAVAVAGMLLAKDTVIATSGGRDATLAPNTTYKAKGDWRETEMPLTVLVNGGTADAAEVLAAALSESERAELAGAKTFGRAIIQTLLPIEADIPAESGAAAAAGADAPKEKHSLLLTVGHFWTPVKKLKLSEAGLEPTKVAVTPDFETWVYDEIDELRADGKLPGFVKGIVGEKPELALELAKGDGGETARYPGWAAFRKAQTNHLSDDQVRWAVRNELRAQLMTAGKLPHGADLQSDTEFVTGLRALAKRADVDLTAIKEYSTISKN